MIWRDFWWQHAWNRGQQRCSLEWSLLGMRKSWSGLAYKPYKVRSVGPWYYMIPWLFVECWSKAFWDLSLPSGGQFWLPGHDQLRCHPQVRGSCWHPKFWCSLWGRQPNSGGPKGWYVWLYHAISCYIHTWRFSYFGTRNHASDSTIFYSILGLKAMVTTEDFGKPLSTLIWETMFSPWQISVFGLQFVRIELLITC